VTETPEEPLGITPAMLLSRRVDFERRMRRFPPVTVAIIAALVLVFAREVQVGALASREGIVAMGALSREGVAAGQYWRLATATLLHGGGEHLVGNALALFILGMVCEHAFGRGQFVVLYVLSGLAGSLVSLATSPGPSVGASGAIFGLQGAAIVLFRAHRDRLLIRDRRIGVVLLVWAVFTIVGGLTSPYIDNGAHVGGALGGALLARGLHPVVLTPLDANQAARVRFGLWLVGAVMLYTVWAWVHA
jgi:rhomboid protease GluP